MHSKVDQRPNMATVQGMMQARNRQWSRGDMTRQKPVRTGNRRRFTLYNSALDWTQANVRWKRLGPYFDFSYLPVILTPHASSVLCCLWSRPRTVKGSSRSCLFECDGMISSLTYLYKISMIWSERVDQLAIASHRGPIAGLMQPCICQGMTQIQQKKHLT